MCKRREELSRRTYLIRLKVVVVTWNVSSSRVEGILQYAVS